jgi:hypothetical protein
MIAVVGVILAAAVGAPVGPDLSPFDLDDELRLLDGRREGIGGMHLTSA